MSKLYEIADQYIRLAEMLADQEMDEQVVMDTIEGLDGEFESKADGIAAAIREEKAIADAIDQEIARLQQKKKRSVKSAEWLKNYLHNAMRVCGKTKFHTALFRFNIQKSAPAVIIDSKNDIPECFLVQQEAKVNKVALKEWLNDHEASFAHLEQSESLRIR